MLKHAGHSDRCGAFSPDWMRLICELREVEFGMKCGGGGFKGSCVKNDISLVRLGLDALRQAHRGLVCWVYYA